MTPRILMQSLDLNGLDHALHLHEGLLQYAYLERETQIDLTSLETLMQSGQLSRWLHGRAFGPRLELRWRRTDLVIEGQAFFESDIAFSGWQESPLMAQLDEQVRARTVLLKGVNVATLPPDHELYDPIGGAWTSEAIPRLLRYPIRDNMAPRLALRCLDYTVKGYVVLTRLADISVFSE